MPQELLFWLQKILKEAVDELKIDEFSELYFSEARKQDDGKENYVSDCVIESDLELLLPADYIPQESERISLYQELDNMERETDILHFVSKLEDRFGRIPAEARELIRVVRLKRLARQLGIEKVVLKQGKMFLYFVSDEHIAYYQSAAFGKLLSYMQHNPRRCQLREMKGKRSMSISNVIQVETAVALLQEILDREAI